MATTRNNSKFALFLGWFTLLLKFSAESKTFQISEREDSLGVRVKVPVSWPSGLQLEPSPFCPSLKKHHPHLDPAGPRLGSQEHRGGGAALNELHEVRTEENKQRTLSCRSPPGWPAWRCYLVSLTASWLPRNFLLAPSRLCSTLSSPEEIMQGGAGCYQKARQCSNMEKVSGLESHVGTLGGGSGVIRG